MKKMKGFRKVLALVLALMMVFSAVSALALNEDGVKVYNGEETWLSDDGAIEEYTSENTVNRIEVSDDKDANKEEISVSVKGIENPGEFPAVWVTDNTDIVSITTNSTTDGIISQNNRAGVHVGTNDGTVNVDTARISSSDNVAIFVSSNDGTINLNKPTDENSDKQGAVVQGKLVGVHIEGNDSDIYLNTQSITGQDGNGIQVGAASNSKYNFGNITINANSVTGGYNGIDIERNEKNDTKTGIITMKTGDVQGTGDNGIEIVSNSGTINQNQENATSGNVTGKNNGINIVSNSGTINLTENTVTGTNGDGIHIGYTDTTNSANNKGNTGTITINANKVTGGDDGIEIENNAAPGIVTVNTGDITATGTTVIGTMSNGIEISNNTGTISIDQTKNDTHNKVDGKDTGIYVDSNNGNLTFALDLVSGDTNGLVICDSSANSKINITSERIIAANLNQTGSDGVALSGNAGEITIKSFDRNLDDKILDSGAIEGDKRGIVIKDNKAKADITADTIKGSDGAGIVIDSNYADITIDAGTITTTSINNTNALEIYNNNAETTITAGKITSETGFAVSLNGIYGDSVINVSADEIIGKRGNGVFLSGAKSVTNLTAKSISGGIIYDAGTGTGKGTLVINASDGVYGGLTVDTQSDTSNNDITINSAVIMESDEYVTGIISRGNDKTIVKANSVTATTTGDGKEAIGMKVEGGTVIIGANDNATGNVTAKAENGESIGLKLTGTENKDVVINGTLTGNTAILLDNDAYADNSDLTVWKMETSGEAGGVLISGDDTGSFAKAINYIVKTVQAATGTFSATKADGSALEKHRDLETAHEDEKVYIKAGEGYKVTEAYNGDTKLESDEGGFFYKVARGGGIMLKAVLELLPKPEENKPEVKPDEKPEEKPEVKPEDKPEVQPVVPSEEQTEAKPEEKPKEEKVESKQEAKTDEPKQEATQTVADTTSTIATTGTATVYNLLKIKDTSGKAELAFRNVGKYEIKSPDGNDEGTFGMEDGKIVLTSQTGKKMNIGQDGKLEYVVGNQTYEFKFGEADLEKLAAVKK
jgi:hypothetical protein